MLQFKLYGETKSGSMIPDRILRQSIKKDKYAGLQGNRKNRLVANSLEDLSASSVFLLGDLIVLQSVMLREKGLTEQWS